MQAHVIDRGGLDAICTMISWSGEPHTSHSVISKAFYLVNQIATQLNTEMRTGYAFYRESYRLCFLLERYYSSWSHAFEEHIISKS